MTVTLTCGEAEVRAEIAARDSSVVRVGRGACAVRCEEEREVRCARRLSERQSTLVVR